MNAVGIDVSKGKSMVAALRPIGEMAIKPFEVAHTALELENLAYLILELDGDTRVVMEATNQSRLRCMNSAFMFASSTPLLSSKAEPGLSVKSRTTRKTRSKSPNTGLTTGMICANIRLWTLSGNNSSSLAASMICT